MVVLILDELGDILFGSGILEDFQTISDETGGDAIPVRHRCDLPVLCSPEKGGELPLPGNYQAVLHYFVTRSIFWEYLYTSNTYA